MLLAGETAPRRARACAPPRPQPQLTAAPSLVCYYRVTLGGRVTPSPAIRRLTACVIAVSRTTPPSIAKAAPVLGGPESVRALCVSQYISQQQQ